MLHELIAVRKQREARALQTLAAHQRDAAARARTLQQQEAALQRARAAHGELARQVDHIAGGGNCLAAQLCAHYASLRSAASAVQQCAAASEAARTELAAAHARVDAGRADHRRACAAVERSGELHRVACKAARLRRARLEELSGEQAGTTAFTRSRLTSE